MLSKLRMGAAVRLMVLAVVAGAIGARTSAAAAGEGARRAAVYSLYVAPDGNDSWSGRAPHPNATHTDGPLATLEGARNALRRTGASAQGSGAIVRVAPGTYFVDHALDFDASDSPGTSGTVVFEAEPGTVRITGGRSVSGWQPVTDTAILARLDSASQGHVLVADLKAQGITDFGSLSRRGFGRAIEPAGLELFYSDRPMTLARWPNATPAEDGPQKPGSFVTIAAVPDGPKAGHFTLDEAVSERAKRWAKEPDPWIHGYWGFDWADTYERVASVDTSNRILSTVAPHGVYGYKKGQRFYALNLLSELDSPGEWYLDRDTGKLYFWPPDPIKPGHEPVVSMARSLVSIKSAHGIEFRGFIFEDARGDAITVQDSSNCRIVRSVLRNIGNRAVIVTGGTNDSVTGCDIYETGDGGINLSGGNRTTLTPAGHVASNNHIYRYSRWDRTYRPAVQVSGDGITVAHNLIHDAPHTGILLAGNDHIVEGNELHNVCEETGDVGAFYTGRDWTARGTILRGNWFHDIAGPGNYGAMAVYLDDQASGFTITGNVFERVTRAIFIGGGDDNIVDKNLFLDCAPAVHLDARGLGWQKAATDDPKGELRTKLAAVPYQNDLWQKRYPLLASLPGDNPGAPTGNIVRGNASLGGVWDDVETKAQPGITFENNTVEPKNTAEQRSKLAGFPSSGTAGVVRDADRFSWPPAHTVRPVDLAMSLPKPKAAARKSLPETVVSSTSGTPITLAEDERGERLPGPPSTVTVSMDAGTLVVRFEIPGNPSHPGDTWGQSDAVEIALQDATPGAGRSAPIYVLRAFANGKTASSTEAGAQAEEAARVAAALAVTVDADSTAKSWHATLRIPLSALGIHPGTATRIAANFTVRTTAGSGEWRMWRGGGGYSWAIDKGAGGALQLAPPL